MNYNCNTCKDITLSAVDCNIIPSLSKITKIIFIKKGVIFNNINNKEEWCSYINQGLLSIISVDIAEKTISESIITDIKSCNTTSIVGYNSIIKYKVCIGNSNDKYFELFNYLRNYYNCFDFAFYTSDGYLHGYHSGINNEYCFIRDITFSASYGIDTNGHNCWMGEIIWFNDIETIPMNLPILSYMCIDDMCNGTTPPPVNNCLTEELMTFVINKLINAINKFTLPIYSILQNSPYNYPAVTSYSQYNNINFWKDYLNVFLSSIEPSSPLIFFHNDYSIVVNNVKYIQKLNLLSITETSNGVFNIKIEVFDNIGSCQEKGFVIEFDLFNQNTNDPVPLDRIKYQFYTVLSCCPIYISNLNRTVPWNNELNTTTNMVDIKFKYTFKIQRDTTITRCMKTYTNIQLSLTLTDIYTNTSYTATLPASMLKVVGNPPNPLNVILTALQNGTPIDLYFEEWFFGNLNSYFSRIPQGWKYSRVLPDNFRLSFSIIPECSVGNIPPLRPVSDGPIRFDCANINYIPSLSIDTNTNCLNYSLSINTSPSNPDTIFYHILQNLTDLKSLVTIYVEDTSNTNNKWEITLNQLVATIQESGRPNINPYITNNNGQWIWSGCIDFNSLKNYIKQQPNGSNVTNINIGIISNKPNLYSNLFNICSVDPLTHILLRNIPVGTIIPGNKCCKGYFDFTSTPYYAHEVYKFGHNYNGIESLSTTLYTPNMNLYANTTFTETNITQVFFLFDFVIKFPNCPDPIIKIDRMILSVYIKVTDINNISSNEKLVYTWDIAPTNNPLTKNILDVINSDPSRNDVGIPSIMKLSDGEIAHALNIDNKRWIKTNIRLHVDFYCNGELVNYGINGNNTISASIERDNLHDINLFCCDFNFQLISPKIITEVPFMTGVVSKIETYVKSGNITNPIDVGLTMYLPYAFMPKSTDVNYGHYIKLTDSNNPNNTIIIQGKQAFDNNILDKNSIDYRQMNKYNGSPVQTVSIGDKNVIYSNYFAQFKINLHWQNLRNYLYLNIPSYNASTKYKVEVFVKIECWNEEIIDKAIFISQPTMMG